MPVQRFRLLSVKLWLVNAVVAKEVFARNALRSAARLLYVPNNITNPGRESLVQLGYH